MLCSRSAPMARVATLALVALALAVPATAAQAAPGPALAAPATAGALSTAVPITALPAAARSSARLAAGRTPTGQSLRARRHVASALAPRVVATGELDRGQTLAPGDSIAAPGGRFSLVNDDGTIVVRTAPNAFNSAPYDEVVVDGPSGASLVMQGDGNLVLYGPDGVAVYSTGTAGTAAARLIVQDDGNLVLYGPTTDGFFVNYDTATPADLLPGGVLLEGDQLSSGDGSVLVMQTDGNLVLYDGTTAVFATGTGGAGNGAVLQSDGNFVVYSSAGAPLYATGTGGSAADSFTAVAVTSGEFRLVNISANGTQSVFGSAWSSDTLLPGHILVPGDRRTAVGGAVLITLQADGNFVKYNHGVAGFKVLAGSDVGAMQSDGNFVLYKLTATGDLKAGFNTRTAGNPGSRLVVQSDNNLVVYTPTNRAVYSVKK